MVYLDADTNLEESEIDAFLYMSSVGSTSQVNIVVQMDRISSTEDWDDDRYGDWTDCKRFNVTQGLTPTPGNAMEDLHKAYLNIGSNIEPERHLREAIRLLRERGQVKAISNVWQSHAYGSNGPDFLNACILFLTSLDDRDLKEQIIHPIEAELGRVRGAP